MTKPKISIPGKYSLSIIAMNVVLVLLIIYEIWFLKGLYTALSGQLQGQNMLHVSRINLDYYHKASDKYNAAQSFVPAAQTVNNPFKSPGK